MTYVVCMSDASWITQYEDICFDSEMNDNFLDVFNYLVWHIERGKTTKSHIEAKNRRCRGKMGHQGIEKINNWNLIFAEYNLIMDGEFFLG